MLSCSEWLSAPSFWMGGGLESRCVGRVYGADVRTTTSTPNTRPTQRHWRPPPNQKLGYTYLLTYSTVQRPSWEANWFAASQKIPSISRNPKVHYRTHKRPPPVPILGQPNPVHIPTSHFLEIRPNIIHPSTPRTPQWSPSLRFPHQDPMHPPLLTHTFTLLCFNRSFTFSPIHWIIHKQFLIKCLMLLFFCFGITVVTLSQC